LREQIDNQKLGTIEGALIVRILLLFCFIPRVFSLYLYPWFEQPYIASTPTSNWRPAPTDPQAFTSGSKFQFSDPSTPVEAVRLVREQNLHFAFGDFDDHLEDVTIGELYLFSVFFYVSCSRLALLTLHFL
jgi:hypothetical protein